jgi:hypothetical protein
MKNPPLVDGLIPAAEAAREASPLPLFFYPLFSVGFGLGLGFKLQVEFLH